MTRPVILSRLVSVLVVLGAGGEAAAHELLVVRQPAVGRPGAPVPAAGPCAAGSEIVRLSDDGAERILTHGFAAACDPAVSFDGTQILFAGRRETGDRTQIWRMDADGNDPVRITDGPGDRSAPLWIGALFHLDDAAPTERIAYLGTDDGRIDPWSGRPAAALYTADLDGGHPLRVSYHPGTDLEPDVLANGRLLLPMWLGVGSADTLPRLSLMALNNDGTDLMAFDDSHDRAALPHAVRVGRDGRVYFVAADGLSPLGGGALVYVTLRRPAHSTRVLAAGGDGVFLDPLPLADGGLLASYRPPGADAVYELHRIEPATGARLGLVSARPGFHTLDAQELAPHPRVKGRSSVVDTSKTTGVFYCISSHLSDRPGLERLQSGAAVGLRVVRGTPREETLGTVPLEPDGSFNIEVPAGVPLRFELVDADGATVAGQGSWTWVMPREWRGCIGCHEDREMAAPNIMADAFTRPAVRIGLPEKETLP